MAAGWLLGSGSSGGAHAGREIFDVNGGSGVREAGIADCRRHNHARAEQALPSVSPPALTPQNTRPAVRRRQTIDPLIEMFPADRFSCRRQNALANPRARHRHDR